MCIHDGERQFTTGPPVVDGQLNLVLNGKNTIRTSRKIPRYIHVAEKIAILRVDDGPE